MCIGLGSRASLAAVLVRPVNSKRTVRQELLFITCLLPRMESDSTSHFPHRSPISQLSASASSHHQVRPVVRFLLLPASPADAGTGRSRSLSFEHLLLRSGRLNRRGRQEKDWTRGLDAYDVIFLEIKDDTDIAYCHELRRVSLKPLFLYGWNIPVATWIHGLQSGADAYLELPASEEVLNAKLRAVLRRSQTDLTS